MARHKEKAVSDEQIVAALMASGSVQQAADAAGIAPRTLHDRMATAEFKAIYNAAKADVVRQAVFDLNQKLAEAIETVAAIMQDTNTPPGIRLNAARTIIDNAGRFAERLADQQKQAGKYTRRFADIFEEL